MAQHNTLGEWGEQLAREYLMMNGYTVFESNQRVGHKEIDIIATKGDRIIFVEVKTRSTDFTDPLDAIDAKKIKRLVKAADSYLQTYDKPHEPQFDVIAVVGTPESSYTLTHIPDAFRAPLSGAW